jgi:hypothetical protein
MPDERSNLYSDLLEGSYDCVDRIILTRHSRNQTGKSVTMPEWASNY